MTIYNPGQSVSYDTHTLPGGDDTYTLTDMVTTWLVASEVKYSQTFTSDQYRTATFALSQYMDGGIIGQNITWSFQVSYDGADWYDLVEIFGETAPTKTLTGTAASPNSYSYPVPLSTHYTRVKGQASATVGVGNTIQVTLAKLVLVPHNILWG